MGESGRSLAVVVVAFLAILAAMSWGFELLLEQRDHPNRNIEANATGSGDVVLQANPAGQYIAPGEINGAEVTFLIDTGATHVAVPEHVAERIGLERGGEIRVETAGGHTTAARTVLDHVVLGGIDRHGVRGSINPSMSGEYVLLGMTFLRHLELQQEGETLVLRESGA